MDSYEASVEREFAGRRLKLISGRFAHRTLSSVVCQFGETSVLSVVSVSKNPKDLGYLPLLVDYREKLYAGGKIKGSRWVKREGRPSDEEILLSRVIDRSIRPMIDGRIQNDIQIVAIPLSVDQQNDAEFPALLASEAAMLISGVPFFGPISSSHIGVSDSGEFVVNPEISQAQEMKLVTTVTTFGEKIVMIEAEGKEASEEMFLKAVKKSIEENRKLDELQLELKEKAPTVRYGIEVSYGLEEIAGEDEILKDLDIGDMDLEKNFSRFFSFKYVDERYNEISKISKVLSEKHEIDLSKALLFVEENYKKFIRKNVLDDKKRIDGRALDEIREVSCEVGIIPRVHGSGHFIRGVTEALTIATLGSPGDAQLFERADEEGEKRFFHFYNFPQYSVGEVGSFKGPSRREIGHGALAEKALKNMIPPKDDFPYTIQLVTEILTSNGSTSMASACGSTLALMDAGVPIKSPVSGVAIGLIVDEKNEDNFEVLTDIQGEEDHYGDMDFKITGTKNGITAVQMDTKLKGVSFDVIKKALQKGMEANKFILDKMLSTIASPRSEISPFAPRIEKINVQIDKIRLVIGRGGETINKIIAETGVTLDIEDDGTIFITSNDKENMEKAKKMILAVTYEPKIGDEFDVRVTRVESYGVFVQATNGFSFEGLIHISKLGNGQYIKNVSDVAKIGDIMRAKLIHIDEQGRFSFERI